MPRASPAPPRRVPRLAQRIEVADVASLAHGEARTFTFDDGEHEGRGFVLMLHEGEGPELHAYRNRCAHVSFDLDMGTGEFFTAKLSRIYCRTHGACYEPRTGVCDRGPCVGARLEKFAVERRGDRAVVSIPAEAATTDPRP
ncbi:MAG: Rieske 2Fe-2S domain-containing protein [Myxococcales bacterium]|nr:Rieske 2Fe-2S domain-containing protein [Myxococcales bacterium]